MHHWKEDDISDDNDNDKDTHKDKYKDKDEDKDNDKDKMLKRPSTCYGMSLLSHSLQDSKDKENEKIMHQFKTRESIKALSLSSSLTSAM